jgi:hypothetical protein
MEIRTLTGHSGWDELLISARREFAKVSELVGAAIDGTLSAPRLPEPVAVSAVGTVHDAFPDDDNDGFYAQWVEMSQQVSELPPCAH